MNYQEQLTNSGYKKHVSESYKPLHSTDTLFQKKVEDSRGIKYFIDVWWYDNKDIPQLRTIKPEMIQIEVQFYNRLGDVCISVMVHEKDIVEAECYIEHMWEELGLGYYEKYTY